MDRLDAETLEHEASLRGVRTTLVDALGQPQRASEDSVRKILDALGPAQPPASIRVAWDGWLAHEGELELVDEDDQTIRLTASEGRVQVPFGVLRAGEGWVLSAPRRAYGDPMRAWGLFAPLYAVSDDGRELGSFSTLRRAVEATRARGGRYFATLPLLPTFADGPRREPSPYSPVTRLGWNELYIDVRSLPEAEGVEIQLPEPDDWVDWDREADVRLELLQALAQRCEGDRRDAWLAWMAEHPNAEGYARHRARDHAEWLDAFRFGQWIAHQQVAAIDGLYLDFPLGVHCDSFDVHRWRDVFVDGVAAGAPPDPLFSAGQNWGFPPMHPDHDRRNGYAYLRACLEHHMRVADVLRIDHVAWLHRLYWIPEGASATDGAYVEHPAPEELYALLSLLSHRHQCRLIGEDLGTVPDAVRHAMVEHGLARTWVLQLFAHDDGWQAPPEDATVTINTHDLPTFAGWWNNADIEDWKDLGLYSDEDAWHAGERRGPIREALRRAAEHADGPVAIHHQLAQRLGEGPGMLLLINLEDLVGETRPQNVPGTFRERPNWRRRASLPLDAWSEHDAFFASLDTSRK